MYREIAQDLSRKIESGELDPGARLPTELELQETYEASRNTVRDALRWLTARGLIGARAGHGTFVLRRIDPFVTTLAAREAQHYASEIVNGRTQMAGTGRKHSATAPRVEVQKASDGIAAMLWLHEGDEVVRRQQLRYIDDSPWSLQTAYYPRNLVALGADLLLRADDISAGAVAYLKETLGLEQVGYEDTIQVGPPDKDVAGIFDLEDDGRVSVLTVYRTCYTTGEHGLTPFRVTITAFPADRNRLRVTSGHVPGSDLFELSGKP
jgi:GntR family transcriptional regulator